MIKFIKTYFVMDYARCLSQACFVYGERFSIRKFNILYAIGLILVSPVLPIALIWYAYQLTRIDRIMDEYNEMHL